MVCVNNQCNEFDDLYIDPNATDKEICEYLVQIGILSTSDMRRLVVEYNMPCIEIYEKKDMKPLFMLVPNCY